MKGVLTYVPINSSLRFKCDVLELQDFIEDRVFRGTSFLKIISLNVSAAVAETSDPALRLFWSASLA